MPARSMSLAGKRALFSMMLQTMPALRGTSAVKAWAGDVPVTWITPPSAKPDRLLYFLHGGGSTMRSIRSHIPLVSRLAAVCGSRALLAEYRLAPEHPYPAALDDSLTAYQWMRASANPHSHIVLAGDSAGAGLAMSLMLSLRNEGEMPLACFLLSPWVDLADTNETPASGRGKSELSLREMCSKWRSCMQTVRICATHCCLLFTEISQNYRHCSFMAGERSFCAEMPFVSQRGRRSKALT